MEQLINFVKGFNFFVLLTDGEGCILNALGDEKILSEAFSLKMVPGAFMNEENIGTNAMSMVIKSKLPVQISGDDHFINAYHKWTCSAAPIKDNKGKLIGVLSLTGYIEFVHSQERTDSFKPNGISTPIWLFLYSMVACVYTWATEIPLFCHSFSI